MGIGPGRRNARPPPRRGWWAGAIVLWAARAASGALVQSDISAIGGDQSRALLGTGAGVIVGIVDGGINAAHPALKGSVAAQFDFTGEGNPGDPQGNGGHGTGVAGLYVGHDPAGYTGLVPAARVVNARSVNSAGGTSDEATGNAMFFALRKGARVINFSLGNNINDGPLTDKMNLMVDWAAENYGASIVSAAGNETASAVAYAPGGAFDGFTAGALQGTRYAAVAPFSNFATRADARTKPDLVAPGTQDLVASSAFATRADYIRADGTTYSTPLVGGVLAQMVGYGTSHRLSIRPEVLKAILLASADPVADVNGNVWAPRHQAVGSGGAVVTDQPLDAQQGAGRVDAVTAFNLYARQPSAAAPFVQWTAGNLKVAQTVTLSLGPRAAGEHVYAALTWLRHVARTDDGNGRVDAGDDFVQSGRLARFNLELIQDGRTVYTSADRADNLNFVSWPVAAAGNYQLRVTRLSGAGFAQEPFALAARVGAAGAGAAAVVSGAAPAPETRLPSAKRGLVLKSLNASVAPDFAGDFASNLGADPPASGPAGVAVVPEPATLAALLALAGAVRPARRREKAGRARV